MGKLATVAILFSGICFSSVQKESLILPSSNSINSVGENIEGIERNLNKITGDIDGLEKNLEDKNRKLLKNIKEKKIIETKLSEVKEILIKNRETLSSQIFEVKKHLQNVLINEVEEQDLPSTLLGKKLLGKVLENKIKELKQIKFRMNQLQIEVDELESRFAQYLQTESDLNQILGNLEFKKKKLAENFYEAQDKKEKLTLKLNKLKAQRIFSKNLKNSTSENGFSTPLEDYLDVSFKEKGLTFKYKGLSQVFASKSGQVVYTGKLSTFGNVLMIDHGNNTRSVILGGFEITVKKGDKVTKGSIIGHTLGDSLKEGSLYFEVRNKDQVQNTIKLMETGFYQNFKDKIL